MTESRSLSLVEKMATERHMAPTQFYNVIKATVMPKTATDEQAAAFLLVADRYGLDPLLKQIHCFVDRRSGGIIPIISIDGWSHMMNNHPAFDGIEFEYEQDPDGKVVAITCRIHRTDRTRPIVITEFMAECRRDTEAWKLTPSRMLRHRAMMQCCRLAFGFSGAFGEDDQDQMVDITPRPREEVEAARASGAIKAPRTPPKVADAEKRAAEKPKEEPREDQVIDGDAVQLPEFDMQGYIDALARETTAEGIRTVYNDYEVESELQGTPLLDEAMEAFEKAGRRIERAKK